LSAALSHVCKSVLNLALLVAEREILSRERVEISLTLETAAVYV
jgi:hypothetical protein